MLMTDGGQPRDGGGGQQQQTDAAWLKKRHEEPPQDAHGWDKQIKALQVMYLRLAKDSSPTAAEVAHYDEAAAMYLITYGWRGEPVDHSTGVEMWREIYREAGMEPVRNPGEANKHIPVDPDELERIGERNGLPIAYLSEEPTACIPVVVGEREGAVGVGIAAFDPDEFGTEQRAENMRYKMLGEAAVDGNNVLIADGGRPDDEAQVVAGYEPGDADNGRDPYQHEPDPDPDSFSLSDAMGGDTPFADEDDGQEALPTPSTSLEMYKAAPPVAQLSAATFDTDYEQRFQGGKRVPRTEAIREDLKGEMTGCFAHGDYKVVGFPTAGGKSGTAARTNWGVMGGVTGGQAVVHASPTRASRDELGEVYREQPGDVLVLKALDEKCPVARGDYDPDGRDDGPEWKPRDDDAHRTPGDEEGPGRDREHGRRGIRRQTEGPLERSGVHGEGKDHPPHERQQDGAKRRDDPAFNRVEVVLPSDSHVRITSDTRRRTGDFEPPSHGRLRDRHVDDRPRPGVPPVEY